MTEEKIRMAYLLILISVSANLAQGIFIKQYNSKHNKGGFTFNALISLAAMMFFLVTDKEGFYIPSGMLSYAVISGTIYCVASFLTYIALGCGSFALSNLILSYSLVFTIGYGILFLKEPVSVYTVIGMLILMLSLFLTRGEKKEEKQDMSAKWLICIILSFVGSGMFNVLSRMQQIRFDNSCTNEYMVLSMGFSAVVLLIAGILKEKKDLPYIMKYGSLYALGAGAMNGATSLLSLIVMMMIPISIFSPTTAGLKAVLSFGVSKWIYKEEFLRRQVIGVMLGVIALVFLNI